MTCDIPQREMKKKLNEMKWIKCSVWSYDKHAKKTRDYNDSNAIILYTVYIYLYKLVIFEATGIENAGSIFAWDDFFISDSLNVIVLGKLSLSQIRLRNASLVI